MRFHTVASARGLLLMLAVLWKYVLSDWVYALHERYIMRQPKRHDAETEETRRMREAFREQWRKAQRQREAAADGQANQKKGDDGSGYSRSSYDRAPLTPRLQYLEELGLQKGARPAQIKKAYRKLVKTYHPDRFAASTHCDSKRAEARAKMRAINEAYDWLEENPL